MLDFALALIDREIPEQVGFVFLSSELLKSHYFTLYADRHSKFTSSYFDCPFPFSKMACILHNADQLCQ